MRLADRFGDKDPDDAFDAGDEELKRRGRWFPRRRWEPDLLGIVRDDE